MVKESAETSEYPSDQKPQPKPFAFSFSPNLHICDSHLTHWLRQVTLRLRREVYWCWHERGMLNDSDPNYSTTMLPPFTNESIEVVNKSRNWEKRNVFFTKDIAMKYLTDSIQTSPPSFDDDNKPVRGSFTWVVKELNLDNASTFVLALGLVSTFDSDVGSIVSSCLNDPLKKRPTMGLAQKLWDYPEEIMSLGDAGHPLHRYGLIHCFDMARSNNNFGMNFVDWDKEIHVPSLVANQLLDPSFAPQHLQNMLTHSTDDPDATNTVTNTAPLLPNPAASLALRLSSATPDTLQIVPICGGKHSANSELVCSIGIMAKRKIFVFKGDPRLLRDGAFINSLATLCWLKGIDLYLGKDLTFALITTESDKKFLDFNFLPLKSIPVTIFLDITEPNQVANIPNCMLLPQVIVPNLSYFERVDCWKKALGKHGDGIDEIILESSKRFRFEKESIESVSKSLKNLTAPVTKKEFFEACRAEFDTDIDKLAQRVTSRFTLENLILPPKQNLQFQEIVNAVKSLATAHYKMGMAQAWNEAGICVLFSGPSGSGKTMAAEILSSELDLPMYRIDISQVVNKYIGETEKNLKLLFDAADECDIILFFDEADSIFGHRTEAKDANDMHANQQISYLLERIERFRGVTILSTNRKKDIDEAFARRIRYALEFPFPGERERRKIWQQMIPKSMAISQSDMEFLAKQFQLSGGNIRSIILNACLQYCSSNEPKRCFAGEHESNQVMEHMMVAVRREYEKIGRFISLEQFGHYSAMLKRIGYD